MCAFAELTGRVHMNTAQLLELNVPANAPGEPTFCGVGLQRLPVDRRVEPVRVVARDFVVWPRHTAVSAWLVSFAATRRRRRSQFRNVASHPCNVQ